MASNSLEQDSSTPLNPAAQDVTSPSLLDLPDTALTQISQHSITQRKFWQGPHSSHPLLAASRGCRDMVLSSIHSISLDPFSCLQPSKPAQPDEPPHTSDSAPFDPFLHDPALWARLLNRACCQANPGLSVQLHLFGIDDCFTELLQPGIDCGGWSKVHSLKVIGASCGAHLIPHAFPALNSLSLSATRLGDGSLFSQLAAQTIPSLTSLTLVNCHIRHAAMQSAAVALAQLPGLRALHLEGPEYHVPTELAEHLTGLTRLTVSSGGAVLGEQQIAVAVQNRGLRSLSLIYGWWSKRKLQPDLLRQVLTSCTGLTQLTLHYLMIGDQGLEVLLTHGTSITDLTLGRPSLTTSKADWACTWRKLELCDGTLQDLAYLPLKAVQQLQLTTHDGTSSALGHLYLPTDILPAQLPDLLHQATTNLASCPAWAKAPPSELGLSGDAYALTSAQRVELLQALAPVGGRHVTTLQLHVKMQLGGAEVEAIAGSFAGSLTSLHLDYATLQDSFWEPLAQHFPSLHELCLGQRVKANVQSVASYLATFLGCVTPGRHACIKCFSGADAVHLQECVTVRGLENIHLE